MNWIRRAVSKNLAWTLAAAVAIVAIVAIAMMPRKKERMGNIPNPLRMGNIPNPFRLGLKPCPYSFQTRGKDGKCRGCPPNTVWDGRRCKKKGINIPTPFRLGIKPCPYSFQTMGKDGQCRGCPPDKPKWDGKKCVRL